MPNRIPTLSREIVSRRDGRRCLRCGGQGREWHHRRSRSIPGDHQHCPCNGLLLCTTCHQWVHGNPERARAEGLIVSRHEETPAQVPVTTRYGVWMLWCDGTFTTADGF